MLIAVVALPTARSRLRAEGLLGDEGQRNAGLFGDFEAIDVQYEGSYDDDLVARAGPPRSPTRRVLDSTEAYEEHRLQRAFLHVGLPSRPDQQRALLRLVAGVLRANPSDARVVECVSIGRQAIVMELLASCSRQMSVNRLSRLIGPLLARYDLQKATLLCYEYDARALIPGGTQGSSEVS